MECYAKEDLMYVNGCFEVYFDHEHTMFEFIERIPDYYTKKYYKKNDSNGWDRISPYA